MGPGWGDEWILGVHWANWTTACSEVPKPRLLAHIDRDPSTSPSSDPTANFQGNLHLMTQVPVHFTFQPSAHLYCQVGVRLGISNQTTYHIAQLRYISKFSQLTSMARPEHIPSYHPSKFSSRAPSQTPFSNSIPSIPLPHTHPTNHFKHPPSLLPLAPPQLHLTHGLSQNFPS